MEIESSSVSAYFDRLADDHRLTVWHMSLLYAIIHLLPDGELWQPINSSRRVLMRFSHIKNLMTYHKYTRELIRFGYLRYEPSYHPERGTLIGLVPISTC